MTQLPTAPIRRMTYLEATKSGLHNRGLILDYKGASYNLSAGTSDKLYVFTKSICIYVLSINTPLGYIALDAYIPNESDPVNSVFLHSEYQFKETMGKHWQRLSPATMVSRLAEYLY